MSACGICEALHFQETNLIQTASENVNNVAIMGSPLGKIVIELTMISITKVKELMFLP